MVQDIGLGFKTPNTAIERSYIGLSTDVLVPLGDRGRWDAGVREGDI